MGEYLFAHFLSEPKEYARAEALWQANWTELLRRTGQEALWRFPWMNTTFADGSSCRDGNPIFSAVSPPRQLGVRVIQLEPEDDPADFTVWTDTFAGGSPEAVRELVISCVLTNENLRHAIELMRQWLTEEKVGSFGQTEKPPRNSETTPLDPTPAFSDLPPLS